MPAMTAIAEIALVSDMSGVCSRGDTRRITSRPKNVDSRNTKSFGSSPVIFGGGGREGGAGDYETTLKHACVPCATACGQPVRAKNEKSTACHKPRIPRLMASSAFCDVLN